MNVSEVKKKIDGVGNITIIFEPLLTYNKNRIPKSNLQEILEKAKVSLRGWSFPHVPTRDDDLTQRPYSIGNGIEFYTVLDRIAEIFRFYQSGQFLAKFALYEDLQGEILGKKIEPGKYLDFLMIIYDITEIFLFIKNLMETADIGDGQVTIEINGVKDRELESIYSQRIMPLRSNYKSRMEKISIDRKFTKEELLINFQSISRGVIKEIFSHFNWNNPSEQMIETHQKNLLERRA